jgi:hypothetical protein
MSAHQMLCHLADAFRVGRGVRACRPVDTPFSRTLVKWVALYLPLAWPAGIATRPEVDPLRDGTKPGDFAADLAALVGELEVFAASPVLEGKPHPIFGAMSARAWLRWGWLHTDHHLRQFGA